MVFAMGYKMSCTVPAYLCTSAALQTPRLDAVNEYYSGIKARCIAKAETYAARVARRTAEIAGLKQALQILDGEAVLLQSSTKRTLMASKA